MKYETHGAGTSVVEVTNVSAYGLWLLINEQEFFLPFEKFPWFREAPIGQVLHVELPTAQHLYWPELDVDLEVESILHPEQYPLLSRVHEAGEGYASSKQMTEVDQDKIDACVLALLHLTRHNGARAWKGLDFEVMNRLFEKGYILDPRNNTKSVVFTEKGLERSKELFEELFRKNEGRLIIVTPH